MDKKEIIFQTLKQSDNALRSGEIAQMSGIDKKEVDNAIKKLMAEGKINSPKRCFYAVS